ncbi:MAG TPA: SpoIIE family protein phosphatase [Candidatus Sulfotelmatobacter sp.]
MQWTFPDIRQSLLRAELWPQSRLARIASYLAGLAVALFCLKKLLGLFRPSWSQNLGGWVIFLVFVSSVLFSFLWFRWLRRRILWRLRNRLIVTYVFIGVIPVVLLLILAFSTGYLFAGQFAGFLVTSELDSQMRGVESANSAINNELAARLERGGSPTSESLAGLKKHNRNWGKRKVCAWRGTTPLAISGEPQAETVAFPEFLTNSENPFGKAIHENHPFRAIVRDHGDLYLRVATVLSIGTERLMVVTSEPLDKDLLGQIAQNLGEVTLYPEGTGAGRRPTFTVGAPPPPNGAMDIEITFGTPFSIIDWKTGKAESAGTLGVRTLPSVLYGHLFASLGSFALAVEQVLLAILIFFAIIECVALIIGTRMTRTVTGAVAQLYGATRHINQGDFSHRIPVKSRDQLAELALSFNSMTESIEKLILEQKEKQRLENELAIAQEVQEQLFPREIVQLESLEVHGFCRPARTVSGDYYDFLATGPHKMILAMGDISGKGISAALLMATIHSAVRAYTIESLPQMREAVAVGIGAGPRLLTTDRAESIDISPGTLLSLLNHQLYESTPPEKYATLFLAIYDGLSRQLSYSNGGHLPPLLVSEDGTLRRLERGGTVVGLFDNMSYEEGAVTLRSGEIFVAYSDGVTEPENDFGEFGEMRLIDLIRDNRHLPLAQISQIVTAAVDTWIGDQEQPDDVTLVLARAR